MLTAALMLVCAQAAAPAASSATSPPGAPTNAPAVTSPSAESGPHIRAGVEAEAEVLPQAGTYDGFVTARPVAGLRVGDDFAVDLGPTFRFRLIDSPPGQRAQDFGGVLRREDWDQASDFGQIIQSLSIAPESSPFFVRAGTVRKKTLGLGHLINRYSNQDNPDYHPAGATVVTTLGPVRAEFFASDMFGARLFAGAVAWDLGRTFSSNEGARDRYVVALELAHDAAVAGNPLVCPGGCPDFTSTQRLTLLQLDASVVFVRNSLVRFQGLAGAGSRSNVAANLGFLAGASADFTFTDLALSAKLEVRKVAGGFRQGLFGPGYELSRFSALGFSGVPIAQEVLPDTFSLYGELRAQVGGVASVDVMAEYFGYGRTDLDATASLTLLKEWLVANARFTVLGLGQVPRYALTAGVRWRLFSAFYLLGSGGTVFFPQPDGTLQRGVTAAAGVGVDFER